MANFDAARNRMVETQIAGRGVRDTRLLEAMRRVPRERFVEPSLEEFAYEDGPLPIGEDQTISKPYIVALMIEATRHVPGRAQSIPEMIATTSEALDPIEGPGDSTLRLVRRDRPGDAPRAQRGSAETPESYLFGL
jgi:hypothetical protein